VLRSLFIIGAFILGLLTAQVETVWAQDASEADVASAEQRDYPTLSEEEVEETHAGVAESN